MARLTAREAGRAQGGKAPRIARPRRRPSESDRACDQHNELRPSKTTASGSKRREDINRTAGSTGYRNRRHRQHELPSAQLRSGPRDRLQIEGVEKRRSEARDDEVMERFEQAIEPRRRDVGRGRHCPRLRRHAP